MSSARKNYTTSTADYEINLVLSIKAAAPRMCVGVLRCEIGQTIKMVTISSCALVVCSPKQQRNCLVGFHHVAAKFYTFACDAIACLKNPAWICIDPGKSFHIQGKVEESVRIRVRSPEKTQPRS